MSRGAVATRVAWGCEREQGAGTLRSADATVRESLAATGEGFVRGGNVSMVWHELAQRHAGCDRRIDAGCRHSGAVVLQGLAEAAR